MSKTSSLPEAYLNCHTFVSPVANFCSRCGHELGGSAKKGRGKSSTTK